MKYRYHIGLDAHSRNCVFAVMDSEGRLEERAKIPTKDSELLRYIKRWRSPVALAFEETTISQWLYVLFENEVKHLVVCDPKANKRPGAKTDKVDAVELADLLRVNRLRPVFHTNDERVELRALVSGYGDLVQEIVRTKNRYSAIYRQSAIRLGGTRCYTNKEMLGVLQSKYQRFVAQSLLEQIALLEEHKKSYQDLFERNMKRFREMKWISSVPGLGPTTTNQIVGIVVSPWRFATKYKLFSYAMLTKHSQMSDGVEYGKRRVNGNSQLKSIFKQAALSATRVCKENAFRRKYKNMLQQGASERAARNAVARALAATVLAVWKRGKNYSDRYREVMQQRCGCRKRT